jgi:hypothetical protein
MAIDNLFVIWCFCENIRTFGNKAFLLKSPPNGFQVARHVPSALPGKDLNHMWSPLLTHLLALPFQF